MVTTPHEADLINADRKRQAAMMQEHLERLGVHMRIAHFTGDSSYPTEYTLTYGTIRGVGPTFDLALLDWIEKLLQSDAFQAYTAMETALQLLTATILDLRTELLVIKGLVAKDGEAQ